MRGDRESAERAFSRAIELHPEIPEAHYNLGLVLQESGRAEDAMARYRAAITLRAAFPEAHNNLGNLLLARGQLEEASNEYTTALRYNPNLAQARDNLARALDQRGTELAAHGEWERAEASYRQAPSRCPRRSGHAQQPRSCPAAARRPGGSRRRVCAGARARSPSCRCDCEHRPAARGARPARRGDGPLPARARGRRAPPARCIQPGPRLPASWRFPLWVGTHREPFRHVPSGRCASELVAAGIHARLGRRPRLAIWKEQGVGDQLVHATSCRTSGPGRGVVVEADLAPGSGICARIRAGAWGRNRTRSPPAGMG